MLTGYANQVRNIHTIYTIYEGMVPGAELGSVVKVTEQDEETTSPGQGLDPCSSKAVLSGRYFLGASKCDQVVLLFLLAFCSPPPGRLVPGRPGSISA